MKWYTKFLIGVAHVVALGMIIVGSLMPSLVANMQRQGVLQQIQLDPTHWSPSQTLAYTNSSTNIDFYVFHVNNLQEVLLNGSKPHLTEVGPVRLLQWNYRFELGLSDDSSSLSFKQLTQYQLADQQSETILNQHVVAINAGYLGAMANVGQQLQLQAQQGTDPSGTVRPTSFPTMSDSFLNSYYIASGVLPTIQSQMIDSTGQLLRAMQLLLIPQYYRLVLSELSTQTGQSTSFIAGCWSTGNASCAGISGSSPFSGFVLPQPLSNPAAISVQLWDPVNQAALNSKAGLSVWMELFAGGVAEQQSASQLLMGAISGLQPSDIQTVGRWVQMLVGGPYQTQYENVMCQYVATTMSNIGLSSDYYPGSWAQVGLLQFGTGLVASLIVDPEYSANGPLINHVPTSLIAILGTQASISSVWVNPYTSHPDLEPTEMAAAVYGLPTISAQPTICNLDIGTAQKLISSMEQSPPAVEFMYEITGQLFSFMNSDPACPNCTLNLAEGYTQGLASAQLQYRGASNNTVNLLESLAPLLNSTTGLTCVYQWVNQYLGHLLTGSLQQIDQYGIAPQNWGLFLNLTVGDLLFGYTSKLGEYIPGYAANWTDLVGWQQTPSVSTSDLVKQSNTTMVGREYQYLTGLDNIETVGQYGAFRGASNFTFFCDRYDPERLHECGKLLYRELNNNQEWGSAELIAGSGDGTQYQPFAEQVSVSQIAVYVDQFRRVVPFGYETDITFKGIQLRQYGVLQDFLSNGSNTNIWRNNAKYYTQAYPDGLVNLATAYNAVPFVASQPHLLGVDASVQATFTGLTPQPQTHRSFIQVEAFSGKTMNAAQRLQANLQVNSSWFDWSNHYGHLFNQEQTLYIPAYWASQYASISDSDAPAFVRQIYNLRLAAHYMLVVMVPIGSVALFSLVLYVGVKARRSYMLTRTVVATYDAASASAPAV